MLREAVLLGVDGFEGLLRVVEHSLRKEREEMSRC